MKFLSRFISIGAILTLAAFGAVSWHFWQTGEDLVRQIENDLELQRLTDETIQLGEVLTLSARMAATSGDSNWEIQYEEFVPQQSTSIRRLLELTPRSDQKNGVLQTYRANGRKIQIERRAFELVQKGEFAEATKLLSSQEYHVLRKQYRDGIQRHEIDLKKKVHERLKVYQKNRVIFFYAAFGVILLLSVFWGVILLLLRREFNRRLDTEQALRGSERKMRKIIDLVPHMIFAKDKEGRFILVNQAMADAYGTTIEVLIGARHEDFHKSKDELEEFVRDDQEVIREGKPKFIPVQTFSDASGRQRLLQTIKIPFLVPGQKEFAVLGVAVDITDQKKAEEKLMRNAFYDSLTDLPTRTLFMDRISEALSRMRRDESYHFAVFYMDLDRFKVVNDSLGHIKGDQLLISIAYRLRKKLQKMDALARVGGDEFGLLVEGVASEDSARAIVEDIRAILQEPFHLDGHEIFTSVSIGVVISAPLFKNANDVLRGADTAMYAAKTNGRRRHEFFNEQMYSKALTMMGLESDLRRAIDRKEFSVFYQPIICVKTQKLVGFESLARWKHPEQGYVSPTQFIPLAEDSGMIVSIGDWVFENVCLQIIDWKARGVVSNNFYVSINVSVRQLHQPDFVTNIKQVLRKSGLDPEFVRIEITETVLLDESEIVLANLEALKRLNLPLYLDDFGTGYSSLSLLRKLDIEKLKIDQSFIRQLENDGESREIVQGVIGLSHNLGIDVIAEGVETLEVFQKLKELGCDYVQGYYFSKPVNSEQAEVLIRKNA